MVNDHNTNAIKQELKDLEEFEQAAQRGRNLRRMLCLLVYWQLPWYKKFWGWLMQRMT